MRTLGHLGWRIRSETPSSHRPKGVRVEIITSKVFDVEWPAAEFKGGVSLWMPTGRAGFPRDRYISVHVRDLHATDDAINYRDRLPI